MEIDIGEASCILENLDSDLSIHLQLVLPCWTAYRTRSRLFTVCDALHVEFSEVVLEASLAEFVCVDITVGSSILVIVLGYFVGHLLQAVASPIDNWVYFYRRDEYPFEKTLQEASSDSVEGRFLDNVDSFFALDSKESDELTGLERFNLTQSYLWNNDIGRAQRFQILYSFLRSMWVLSGLGALLHLLGLIAMLGGIYQLVWTPSQSSVIIVALALASIGSYLRRVQYHKMMVDALIFDFYANVLS